MYTRGNIQCSFQKALGKILYINATLHELMPRALHDVTRRKRWPYEMKVRGHMNWDLGTTFWSRQTTS